MTDTPYKGGRNRKAPYRSTHIRVPEDIKSSLQSFADIYRVICALNDNDGLQTFKTDLKKFVDCFVVIEAKLYCNAKLVNEETELWIQSQFKLKHEQLNAWENLFNEQVEKEKKAEELLVAALTLKSNSGGAIKKEIKKAIELLK